MLNCNMHFSIFMSNLVILYTNDNYYRSSHYNKFMQGVLKYVGENVNKYQKILIVFLPSVLRL